MVTRRWSQERSPCPQEPLGAGGALAQHAPSCLTPCASMAAPIAGRERQAQAHIRRPGADAPRVHGHRQPKALTPARRELVVQALVAEHGMSERRACQASGIARPTTGRPSVLLA